MNIKEESVQKDFYYFGGISFLYGLLFAFCLYKNLFGVTFLIYALATVTVIYLFMQKIGSQLKKETKAYFVAIVLCSISTCITANFFIQFFNWCCIIFLLFLVMLHQFFENKKWNFWTYFVNMLALFFSTIGLSFTTFKETSRFIRKGEKKKVNKNVSFVIIGLISGLGILLVILPLLLSSDAVFRDLFSRLFRHFSFIEIFQNFDDVFGIAIMVLLGFMLMYGFFRASCRAEFPDEPKRGMPVYSAVTGISFSAVIAGVYLLYSGIQIMVLFFKNGGVLPAGMTYSEYAHSGFWQLVLVAMINIVMVLLCKYLFENKTLLNIVLTIISVCTFVMIASAAFRMYLYVETYQMTFLRLLVFWFLLILALIMSGVIVTIYKETFSFIRYGIWVAVCGYLVFSFMRPDYWVAKYNVNHIEEMNEMDVEYMLSGLSVDAAPVIAQIDTSKMLLADSYNRQWTDNIIYSYFEEVSADNQDIYFRKANYSRIKAKHIAETYLEKGYPGEN